MPSTGDSYDAIRAAYYQDIYTAMFDYLTAPEGTRITKTKLAYKRAINDNFWSAFEEGYQAGGAELPLEAEPFAWIKNRIAQEFDYVGGLFNKLRDEIKPDGTQESISSQLDARAEGYTQTLDGVYGMGKVFGAGSLALTLVGSDGKEHCATCAQYKGQTHPANWWTKRDLVPYPGNRNYICGNWEGCQHYLADKWGNMFTL